MKRLRRLVLPCLLPLLGAVDCFAAEPARLTLRSDADCELRLGTRALGRLEAGQSRSIKVSAGPLSLSCRSLEWPDIRVERSLNLRPGGTVDELLRLRWAELEDGLLDRRQQRVWLRRDNDADISWAEAGDWCAQQAPAGRWRLPTRPELEALYRSGAPDEAIDCRGAQCRLPALFTLSSYWLWSADRHTESSAWYVYLHTGHTKSSPTDYRLNARALCVRSVDLQR